MFGITCFILLATVCIALVVFFTYYKEDSSFFSLLRPVFQNILPTAVTFLPEKTNEVDPSVEVDVVFVGYKERRDVFSEHNPKNRLVRIWVHVYFTIICSIIIIWALSVFSDTVLYLKSTSCRDLSVKDTDSTCFLLSTRDIPQGVQDIIDNREGGLVPCQQVQDYLMFTNSTFDLEVICYQSQLHPLAALGVAYGTMKSIAFAIITLITLILIFTAKIHDIIHLRCQEDEKKEQRVRQLFFYIFEGIQITFSILVIIATGTLAPTIHEVKGARNSAIDYLRGERFYHFSVIILLAITAIFVLGLFPWWAFEQLKPPRSNAGVHGIIHSLLLHFKFTTSLADQVVFGFFKEEKKDNPPKAKNGDDFELVEMPAEEEEDDDEHVDQTTPLMKQ